MEIYQCVKNSSFWDIRMEIKVILKDDQGDKGSSVNGVQGLKGQHPHS